jgi:membrane fusion protein, heavy metal efflux system
MKTYVFIISLVIATALNACHNHSTETVSEDDHKHDDVKVLITGYSDKFELFAEADPFAVGSTSSILVHLTHLENFKPLQEGKVTLSMIIGTKGIRQSIEQPALPGIYRFSLTPEVEGSARIIVDVETPTTKQQIEVRGFGVYADEHTAIHEAEANAVNEANAFSFTKEQSWKIDFATKHPVVEPFGQAIKTTAQIQPAQGDEVIVTAKTNGVVTIPRNGLLEGQKVNEGEHLLSISASGLAENSWNVRFAEAKNNYEKAKADFERMSQLAKDKIIPEKELLTAKTDYENAKALFDNLNENFSAKGQRVVSPLNGYTKQLFVQNGQYIEVGHPIITVSQNKNLLLTADVQQKFASVLGAIVSANIRTLYDNKTYTLSELNGKIVSYGRSVNPDNFMIPVILQIDNKGSFVPGGFVELYLKVLTNSVALTVLNTALLEEQGQFFVMVQVTPELFEKRVVQIGSTDGIKTEVLSGLDQSDRIVSKGAMLVKLAQAAAALDPHSGHVH